MNSTSLKKWIILSVLFFLPVIFLLFLYPSTHNYNSLDIVQNNIKAENAWAFDLSAACSGFLYSLETGARFIESGKYKYIMVIGVDTMTSILDFKDRETCIIFGDGAGGVILEASKSNSGISNSMKFNRAK